MTFSPATRVKALPPNFFDALTELAAAARARGEDVIDVSRGNPDLPTPEHIVRAMQRAVAEPRNHAYPSFLPRPALAEAIARRYRADHGIELDPASQVAVFHGSHEGLMAAVLASADPGSTVVLPDPGYPAYLSAAELAGASVRPLPLLRETGYQPDFAALADLPRAAALLLNYPNNPTGAVATAETLAAAGAEARRLGALLVHDFAYGGLGFDARPLSALPGAGEDVVELSTLSKTYSMAGWRIGFAAGSADVVSALIAYQSHAFSSVFGAVQDAAAAALAGDQGAAEELVEVYRARRDLVVGALRSQGWDIVAPQGGFFVWLRVGGDDRAFAERMLREHAVVVAPGSGFGPGGRGYVRLGLVHPESRLIDLVERMGRARGARTPDPTP